MKATLLTGISLALITLSTATFSEKSHHEDKNDSAVQATAGKAESKAGMPMMDMDKMHEHMTKMKKNMEVIHNTSDREERQKLMQQHMKEMHKGMGMMASMKTMKGKCEKSDSELKPMAKHHAMMENRMEMMQTMMSQMMEHMMLQHNTEKK